MDKKFLAAVQVIIGYEWLVGGWEKIAVAHKEFVLTIAKTLEYFSSKNPYAFYKGFLLNSVIPAKEVYAYLVPWGEFLVGLALIIGGLLIFINYNNKYIRLVILLALVGSIFMNLNYWFAAGWTSPSTEGFNLILGLIELVLFVWQLFQYKNNQA